MIDEKRLFSLKRRRHNFQLSQKYAECKKMKLVRAFYVIILVLTAFCCTVSAKAEENAQKSGNISLVGHCGVSEEPGCGPITTPNQSACPQGCTHCVQTEMQQPGPAFPALRRAFAQPQQSAPVMGMRPLIAPRGPYAPHAAMAGPVGYGMGGGYPGMGASAGYPFDTAYPKGHCAFPRLQKIFCPDQCFMSTSAPAEPMKTYTNRGPRDFFLNDKPSSIGY